MEVMIEGTTDKSYKRPRVFRLLSIFSNPISLNSINNQSPKWKFIQAKGTLLNSNQFGVSDKNRVSYCGQPHSLPPNAMQSEQHEWSVTRIEVESFHFECELSFGQTRGWGNSNQVWERVISVLSFSKSEACCNHQLCHRTS